MRLAILGGSFNPVHIGHLFLADTVLSSLSYDRLIFVPAFQSPFKTGAEGASHRDRLEMLAASIAGDPRLTLDDCEIKREGVSYTIDTLIDIIGRYRPEGKPGLILGDDLASTFDKWQKPDEIAGLVDFIIARREVGVMESFPYPYTALNNEIMNVSSSSLREKIGSGDAWRSLVSPGVRCIIEARGLYSFAGEPRCLAETIVRLENAARSSLRLERFIHSRNTALLAADLCRRFGLDPDKGYLAGIAHDICKELGDAELVRLAKADGGAITKLEHRKPGLLHARAAAVFVQRRYGINDKDILEAIRYHTTGSRDIGPLAKIVYVADKLELSRPKVDPGIQAMGFSNNLDSLFMAVLGDTVINLRSRKLDISHSTKKLLAAMQERNNS